MINLQDTLQNHQVYYKFKDSKRPTAYRPPHLTYIKNYRKSQISLINLLAEGLQEIHNVKTQMSFSYTFVEGFKIEDELLPEFVDIRDIYRHYKIDYEIVEISGEQYIQFKGANSVLLSFVEHKIIDKEDFVDTTPNVHSDFNKYIRIQNEREEQRKPKLWRPLEI